MTDKEPTLGAHRYRRDLYAHMARHFRELAEKEERK